jgi:hypothetical protein
MNYKGRGTISIQKPCFVLYTNLMTDKRKLVSFPECFTSYSFWFNLMQDEIVLVLS